MSESSNKIKSTLPILISIVGVIIALYINSIIGAVLLFLMILYLLYTKRHLIYAFQGTRAYNTKDYPLAIKKYKKAIDTGNANGSIINNYFIMELKHGNSPLSEESIDLAISKRNFKANDLINLNTTRALILWKNNEVNESLELLKKLLKDSKNTYIYETLTTLLLVNGRTHEAMEFIKEGLEYTDSSNVLLSNFGEANYIFGNFDESKKIFESLLEDNVSFIEPYYYSALISKKNGDIDLAINLLKKAVNMNDSLVSIIKKADVLRVLEELSPVYNDNY